MSCAMDPEADLAESFERFQEQLGRLTRFLVFAGSRCILLNINFSHERWNGKSGDSAHVTFYKTAEHALMMRAEEGRERIFVREYDGRRSDPGRGRYWSVISHQPHEGGVRFNLRALE